MLIYFTRLDFEAFVLLGPTATSDTTACVDSFIATVVSILFENMFYLLSSYLKWIIINAKTFHLFQSPSGYATSKICGTNTGEHSMTLRALIICYHYHSKYT